MLLGISLDDLDTMPITDYITWVEYLNNNPPWWIVIQDQLALLTQFVHATTAGNKINKDINAYKITYTKQVKKSMDEIKADAANMFLQYYGKK